MARLAVATRLASLLAALITAAIAAGGVVSAQTAAPPTWYVVAQTPGPAWKAGEDARSQPLADHFRTGAGCSQARWSWEGRFSMAQGE